MNEKKDTVKQRKSFTIWLPTEYEGSSDLLDFIRGKGFELFVADFPDLYRPILFHEGIISGEEEIRYFFDNIVKED